MKVFITGATGFVGSAIVQELIKAGHEVTGLSRNEESDQKLISVGALPYRGDLNDPESLRDGAAESDGVIHTAFDHDFSKFAASCENDRRIIGVLGDALAGSERPLIITSALGILPRGRLVDETVMPVAGPIPRIATEEAADAAAALGVRVAVVRLPPSVHGDGDHGFVPMLINIAREKGISVYEEGGLNRWPSVHRLDAAKLYRRALEQPAALGTRYHAVAEEGVLFKEIAEAIGKGLNIPAVSQSKVDSATHFGSFAHFAAMDIHASGEQTQVVLNWHPAESGLIADLHDGFYFSS